MRHCRAAFMNDLVTIVAEQTQTIGFRHPAGRACSGGRADIWRWTLPQEERNVTTTKNAGSWQPGYCTTQSSHLDRGAFLVAQAKRGITRADSRP